MNEDIFGDGKPIYLPTMLPPEEMAPAIPHYVNGNVISSPNATGTMIFFTPIIRILINILFLLTVYRDDPNSPLKSK